MRGAKEISEYNHGTYSMYGRKGCRCDECREYARARTAKNRAERLAAGRITHGSRSGYDAGCRCRWCKNARRDAARTVDNKSMLARIRAKRYEEARKVGERE